LLRRELAPEFRLDDPVERDDVARVRELLRPLDVLPPPRVVARDLRALLPRLAPPPFERIESCSEERLRVLEVLPRAEVERLVFPSRPLREDVFLAAEREPAFFAAEREPPEERAVRLDREEDCRVEDFFEDALPEREPLREALRPRPPTEFSTSSAVSRLTILLKLLRSPPAVSSWYSSARLCSSNLLNHSSQPISSSDPAPLYPGKSSRMMPGSSSLSVRITAAGFAPRSSAQRRISSRSVVTLDVVLGDMYSPLRGAHCGAIAKA
jgi:hypothetical protein